MKRRQFLKLGILGAVFFPLISSCSLKSNFLESSKNNEKTIMNLMEVLVGSHFSSPIAESAIKNMNLAIKYMDSSTQKEILQILFLFENTISRFLIFRSLKPLEKLSHKEMRSGLDRMKRSSFSLLRSAHQGIRDLSLSFYYSSDKSWNLINYPGPMEL